MSYFYNTVGISELLHRVVSAKLRCELAIESGALIMLLKISTPWLSKKNVINKLSLRRYRAAVRTRDSFTIHDTTLTEGGLDRGSDDPKEPNVIRTVANLQFWPWHEHNTALVYRYIY